MPAEAEADPVTPKVVETRPPPDAGRAAIRADDPPCADLPSPDPHGRTVADGSRTAPEQFHAVPRGLIRQQPMQRRAADCETRALGEIRRHQILQSDEMDPLQRESGALREWIPRRSATASAAGIKPSPQALSCGGGQGSVTITRNPLRRAAIAAIKPAGPPPTIRTSVPEGGTVKRFSW